MATEIATTARKDLSVAIKRSWPVAFSQWLERGADPRTMIDPPTLRASLLRLGDEAKVREWLAAAIAGPPAAMMRDYVTQLGRLSLHYWRPDFTPEQAKLMFQDFASDMAGTTAAELVEACNEWRRDPENRFFPRPGELLELVKDRLRQRGRDRYAARRMLEMLDGKDEPSEPAEPKRIRTAAEILEAHGVTMPKTSADADAKPVVTSRQESPETAAELRDRLNSRIVAS